MGTHKKNYILSGILLVSLSLFNYALDPQKKITQYMHESWGLEEGLPVNSIDAVIQSRDGYLWLGTQEGLVRFDGVDFTVFEKSNTGLPSHHVRSIHQDRGGNLWLGTYSGLARLNAVDNKFVVIDSDRETSGIINAIHEDRNGDIWYGTEENGLKRLKSGEPGESGTPRITGYSTEDGLSDNSVRAVITDGRGNLWIGTGNGLNRLEPGEKKFTVYTKERGPGDNNIYSLYNDNGNLWIGTDNGLDCLAMENGGFTARKFPAAVRETLSGLSIRAIRKDRDGNLWLGSQRKGMIRLNPRGLEQGKPELQVFTAAQGLSDNTVTSFHEDVEGSLWVGTWSGGLNRFKDGKFTAYTTAEGLSGVSVLSVYEDPARGLWIGTDNGLDLLTPASPTGIKHYLPGHMVYSICKDPGGKMWIGSYGGGLCRPDGSKINGLSNNFVKALYVDSRGTLWIGTEGGLIVREDGDFKTITTKDGLTNNTAWSIYEDRKGSLWVGTRQGLNRLEHPTKDGKLTITTYTVKDGLSSDTVGPFHEDREGNLWIGTFGGGLNRLKDGKFTHVTTKQGLFNDVVFTILEDHRGNFWMSCNKGIYRASRKELADCCDGKISRLRSVSYNEKDGMISREGIGGSQPPGWKGNDGKLWFPTIKGLVTIDPANIPRNTLPPPVKIEKITVDDRKILPPFPLNENKKLVLSPGKTQYEIHYTALSFLVPGEVRFKYKLEGFDTAWHDVGTRRTAYYSNLSPGNYSFRVIACNADGTWNETGAAVSFYLKPDFYQTWWFYALCAVAGLLLVFGIFRLRVKQVTDRKKELERLVEERTRQLKEAAGELEKLSIVARETDNAVTILDARGNLEWMNEAAVRRYGYTRERLFREKGRNITQISSHPDIERILAGFVAKPEPLHYESLYTTGTGKKIWTLMMWSPILDKQGKLTGIISIGFDITRSKQSEERIKRQNEEIREQNRKILEQAERLKEAVKIAREERKAANAANHAKSEFLARMSHEIRTPMNSVIGFSEMLLDTPLNEEQRDYIHTMARSGDALIAIINDILDFSSIEAGKLTFDSIDFDPEVLVFDVCELTMPRVGDRPIEVLCRVGDRVPALVKQDAGRFRQVLINLMGNAAKFTKQGEIQLSIDVAEEKDHRLKLHTEIRDTGIGIPPDKLGGIFEAFQQVDGSVTREFGGTGLGLAISKQIAEHMGGDILVESTPGQGSTFHFYAWVEKSKKPPPEKPVYIDLSGKRVLIVDDNSNNLDILEHILKKHGMTVVRETDSRKVVPLLVESLGEGTPFDLCILDLLMPGMDGNETARRIRAHDSAISKVPLLAFSSSGSRQAKEHREYGFDAFLPKPIRSTRLLKVVEQLFRPGKEGGEGVDGERSGFVTRHSVFEEAKHSVYILLAEDNAVNRKLTEFMLTRAGYRLDIAENGAEAVEKYASDPGKYDLIFMDIQMPVLDGREATKQIREMAHGSTIPIIAMTAESMKGDREKCLAAGMDDYISKPIRREIVFEMIKKWVLAENK